MKKCYDGTHHEHAAVLMLLMSAGMKFVKPAPVVEGSLILDFLKASRLDWNLELACTVIYVIPRTSILARSC